MSYSFNPPPQWPKPPEGWEPGPGWQPDPAWGPAPEGWNFWVDENGAPVDSGNGGAQGVHPPQGPASPEGSAPQQGSPTPPTEPLGAQPPQGSTAPPTDSQGSGAPQGWAAPEGAPQGSATPSTPAEGAVPSSGPAGPGAAGVGTETIGAGAGTAGSSAGGPPSGGPGGPYQGAPGNLPGGPGGGNGGKPARKKNFFTSGAGIALLGSGLVLILIIVVVVMMTTGVFGGKKPDPAPADSSSSSSPAPTSESTGSSTFGSSSDPSQDSHAQDAPTAQGIPAHQTKPFKTLSGSGDKTVDAGLSPGTVYYVEYTYSGNSNFALWGKNKDGERSGLLANEINATSGSHWVNADDLYRDVTGFSVQAGTDEKWELKVFTGESLAFEPGESYDLSGSQAVSYASGEAKKATLRNTSETTMTVEVRDVQGKSLSHAMVAAGQSATVDLPASSDDKPTLIQVETQNVKDTWSFSTE